MKSQNRETLKRQRMEQNELRSISQYQKVQKQYMQSELSKEKLQQGNQKKNAGNYADLTPPGVCKPASKDGTGTI